MSVSRNKNVSRKRTHEEALFPSDEDEMFLDPSNDAIMEAHKRSREEAFSSDDSEEEDDDYFDDYYDDEMDDDDYYYDDEMEEDTPEPEMSGGGVSDRPPLFEFQTRPLEPKRN
jgi:hypothetical protein